MTPAQKAAETRRWRTAWKRATQLEKEEALATLAERMAEVDPGEVRQFMVQNAGKLFRRLVDIPEGRALMLHQRAKALSVLRSTKDWRDAGYASFMVLTVNTVLDERSRKAAESRSKASRKHMREELQRIQDSAEFISMLLHTHAFEPHGYFIGAKGDFSESWSASKRVHRKAGDLLEAMGFRPNPPTGHMQRPRAQGDTE